MEKKGLCELTCGLFASVFIVCVSDLTDRQEKGSRMSDQGPRVQGSRGLHFVRLLTR